MPFPALHTLQGRGAWQTVPCQHPHAWPVTHHEDIKLPVSRLPGSICLSGTGSCRNKANEEERPGRKKKRFGEDGEQAFNFYRRVYCGNAWKSQHGSVERQKDTEERSCCRCSYHPSSLILVPRGIYPTKIFPAFPRDWQKSDSQ